MSDARARAISDFHVEFGSFKCEFLEESNEWLVRIADVNKFVEWLARIARMNDASQPTEPPKPFGKAMVEVYEGMKRDFGNKPSVDQNVREQVDADLDGLIGKNRARKW
jgi:hypothetical protein